MSKAPSQQPAAVPAPSTVGNSFVKQYYHLLAESPEKLHRFYKDSSTFTRGSGSRPEVAISGQKSINEKIMSMNYAGARVDLESGSVDCQSSLEGGVLVMVSGMITLASKAPKAFVQTFFLAVQPNGYFVLNDAFRYLESSSNNNANKSTTSVATTGTSVKVETVSAMTSPMHAPSKPPLPSSPPASPKMRSPKKGGPASPKVVNPASPPLPPTTTPAAAPASPKTAEKAAASGPKSWASLFAGKAAAAAAVEGAIAAPVDSKPTKAGKVKDESGSNARNASSSKDAKSNNTSRSQRGVAVLIIRDIPQMTKEGDLRAMFNEFGNITAINVVAHRGHAFVDFDSMDAVKKALESKREFKVGDKKVQVEEKYAARNNPDGRGGYNGGRGGRGGSGGRSSVGGNRAGRSNSSFKNTKSSAGSNNKSVNSAKPVRGSASRSD